MPDITLDDVIAVANEAYGDDLVLDYHQGEERGDTLAKFIAIELRDTFDPEDHVANNLYHAAADYMQNAVWDLADVVSALRAKGRAFEEEEDELV